ncbi:MAG: hypothetical protein MUC47_07190 [Candidatus Kapabacteria bacterium]|jgi:hypothetical protein|nr:hypothetical protein [Candidatus Kapabacteria bacterium]
MRITSILAALVLAGTTMVAQEPRPYHLYIGPTLGFVSGGINTVQATGRKVNPTFWAVPSYGVAILAPFSPETTSGFRFDFGVTTVGSKMRPYESYGGETNWKGNFDEHYRHFTIATMVNLSGFAFGAGFNIPMAGTMTAKDGSEYLVEKNTLTTAIDVRLGGIIPVWESEMGILNVEIMARYFLTGVYSDGRYTAGTPVDANGEYLGGGQDGEGENFVPAGLTLGVSYLFDLIKY